MSQRTTQFIYSLFGINQNPPTPAPPTPASTSIPTIHGSSLAADTYPNPLNDAAVATTLRQVNNGIATAAQFDKEREFNIFVPSALVTAYKNAPAGSKPIPKVALFYGVGVELTLFRIRDFFAGETNSAVIVISGVEAEAGGSWVGIHTAFGYGITKEIIVDLFKTAGLTGMPTSGFDVEVMAGYSTGYRGVNLTIINELVDLSKLKRLIYFDAWYFHNDHPLMPNASPYRAKNTLFAIDTAMTKSPSAEVVIYAFTTGGVPRNGNPAKSNPNPPKHPVATLITKYPGKIKFIDFEWKFGTRPAIDFALEKICLARLISLGIGSKFTASAVAAGHKALIDALPAKGALGTLGRPGYTDLYGWITGHTTELAGFNTTAAMTLVVRHDLLSDPYVSWTTSSLYEMRHRMFIIELGKEPLLP